VYLNGSLFLLFCAVGCHAGRVAAKPVTHPRTKSRPCTSPSSTHKHTHDLSAFVSSLPSFLLDTISFPSAARFLPASSQVRQHTPTFARHDALSRTLTASHLSSLQPRLVCHQSDWHQKKKTILPTVAGLLLILCFFHSPITHCTTTALLPYSTNPLLQHQTYITTHTPQNQHDSSSRAIHHGC
jgi:hypothetical protein